MGRPRSFGKTAVQQPVSLQKYNLRAMQPSVLYVKNMVCQRCIKVVKAVLKEMRIPFSQVTLGEISLNITLNKEQLGLLDETLRQEGFSLLGDKNSRLVEQIKNIIIAFVHDAKTRNSASKLTFSHYLAQQIGHDYGTLSQLFSSVEGLTIEKYVILQKIERVKELLRYGELNLTQIAEATGYSSVQYLSNQFKRVTGLSPNNFKKLKQPRQGIDAI